MTPGMILAYDADCGPCARFKAAVEFLDPKHRIRFVPLDVAERGGMLEAIEPASRYRSFHVVSWKGRPLSGAEAVLPLSRSLFPFLSGLSVRAEAVSSLRRAIALAYALLSRAHAGGACGAAR